MFVLGTDWVQSQGSSIIDVLYHALCRLLGDASACCGNLLLIKRKKNKETMQAVPLPTQ